MDCLQLLRRVTLGLCWLTVWTVAASVEAADWPMWRHDSGRTGVSDERLPVSLRLQWVRTLPAPAPAFRNPRLQFDAAYEPIVADGLLLIASSRTDSVTAYDAATGRQAWRVQTNGPVRFAPAVWRGRVCFGADDGCLYCVDLKSGDLRWKYRAVPSSRLVLGNRRLISLWPVRGGPVVADGVVYFAAGVWPFEGAFVQALDVETGALIWRNERLGYLFGQHPHSAQSIGGLAPQGYLVIEKDELIVPCSTAYPARLDRRTGKLIEFALPIKARFPGGWFAALDAETADAVRRGKLSFDQVVNTEMHEDNLRQGDGTPGISRQIRTAQKTLQFDKPLDGVEGTIHSMAVADGRLFVSTREGRIYCFGDKNSQQAAVKKWPLTKRELTAMQTARQRAQTLVKQAGTTYGHAVVLGLGDGELVKALLLESQFQVTAIDDDPGRVARLREELEAAGLYGTRAAVMEGDPCRADLPRYLATVLTTAAPERIAALRSECLQTLRPFGGIAALQWAPGEKAEQVRTLRPGNFVLSMSAGEAIVRRVGPLPGSEQYTGDYAQCPDELVRFPLGVLWFDDTLSHFKRSVQPQFADGVMISQPKDWSKPRSKERGLDYPLLPTVFSDIYTGRVMESSEASALRAKLPADDLKTLQPIVYHPPHQKTLFNPVLPDVGKRTNPLTGELEPRLFPKSYGCDGGVDYGLLYTLRSGTAAYYDKGLESGTVYLSGPRSGCTNSIIPTGGVLNVPFFYDGCTCSYPLPVGMSLATMPESFEQWSTWGEQKIEPGSIQRVGINLGAPGDRMTRDGTLWLDYPIVGGPSPQIRIETTPAEPTYRYRHSLWMNEGDGWSWVVGSAAEGLKRLTLQDLRPGRYTVRLYFAELDDVQVGERVQTVSLQGRTVLAGFDILAEAKATRKGIVRTFADVEVAGELTLELTADKGNTLIGGIEVIRAESER